MPFFPFFSFFLRAALIRRKPRGSERILGERLCCKNKYIPCKRRASHRNTIWQSAQTCRWIFSDLSGSINIILGESFLRDTYRQRKVSRYLPHMETVQHWLDNLCRARLLLELFLVKHRCDCRGSSNNVLSSLPSEYFYKYEKSCFYRIMTDSSSNKILSSWHKCGRGRNKGREREISWMGVFAKKVPSTTAWKKVLTTWTDGRKMQTNVSVFAKGDSCSEQTSNPKQAHSMMLCIYTYSSRFSLATRQRAKYWSC